MQRFVDAQAGVYESAIAELSIGKKRSHWMWFVFPQLKGLGVSSTSRTYGISGLSEARAYLRHPVLGPRLRESTSLVLAFGDRSPRQIFGYPDDMKFRSSMTLFSLAAMGEGGDPLFDQALDVFFASERDARTVDMLEAAGPGKS